jgi:3-deoxy-D-manno-octulosonic-acid transferase
MALYFLQSVFLFLVILGSPLIAAYIITSSKRRQTFIERLGYQPLCPPIPSRSKAPKKSRPIWIHALSVGEVLSAEPLIKAAQSRWPHQSIAVSVTTATGYDIAREILPEGMVTLFYFPYDFSLAIHRIVKAVNPALVIIVETDLWPVFLMEMQRRHIPVFLVNARLSPRSYRNYSRLGRLVRPILNIFASVCVQSLADAQRFIRLGLIPSKVKVTGNVKYDQLLGAHSRSSREDDPAALSLQADQQVWVAGSTHPGEEAILLRAFAKLKQEFPQLLLIVAPRDPMRSSQIRQIALKQRLRVDMLTKLTPEGIVHSGLDVLIIDTLGLLKRLYGLATIAFVGGSLVPCGGHNPIEPAAYACPILFGPDMTDFREVAQLIMDSEGALQVADDMTLFETAYRLLSNPGYCQKMGQNAHQTIQRSRGAVKRSLDVIEPYLLKNTPPDL